MRIKVPIKIVFFFFIFRRFQTNELISLHSVCFSFPFFFRARSLSNNTNDDRQTIKWYQIVCVGVLCEKYFIDKY